MPAGWYCQPGAWAIGAMASRPKGLFRLKKLELQREMASRGLAIHRPGGEDKVREEMIRDIELHADETRRSMF